jgi:hypothetical protein
MIPDFETLARESPAPRSLHFGSLLLLRLSFSSPDLLALQEPG